MVTNQKNLFDKYPSFNWSDVVCPAVPMPASEKHANVRKF